jgi:y4mF family transcriptional regulator
MKMALGLKWRDDLRVVRGRLQKPHPGLKNNGRLARFSIPVNHPRSGRRMRPAKISRAVKCWFTNLQRCTILPFGNLKMKTTEQLGMAIRTRRRQLRITQKELAMTCGTGLRFIVDLEKGKATCQIGKTLQVFQALGLAIETTPLGGGEFGGQRP